MGIEGSQFYTNPLPSSPCRCCTWVTSPLEHLRNSRLSLTQAHLTCGCPPYFAPVQPVGSIDTPYPDHLSITLMPCFPPLAPDDTHLFCLQLQRLCSDIFSLPPSFLPIRPSGSPMDLGKWKELLLMTQFG